MTVVAISQLPLRRRELDTEIPNSIITTFYMSTSSFKTVTSLFSQPTPGVPFNRSCAAAICSWLGGLQRSCWDHLRYHHHQLLVCCFLSVSAFFFFSIFSNLQPGWANSAMETMEMFAFCPCFIDSESADCEASPNPRHSSKRTSAASSRAQQLLALWAMVMR